MAPLLGALAVLLAVVCGAAATEIAVLPAGGRDTLFAQAGNTAPRGAYTIRHDLTELEINFPFPIRSLRPNDLQPVPNPLREKEVVCCPPGTVFDGQSQSCVFLASSVCPKGFTLDEATKSICISETPPCPGDLILDNGRCVSHEPPQCVDDKAVYNKETQMCEAIEDPTCDAPLGRKDDMCVSPVPPRCDIGFRQDGPRCVLIAGPTCNSPDPNSPELMVHYTPDGKAVCVSINPPECPGGASPVDDKCQIIKEPECPEEFEPKEGSCIYTGSPCPKGGVFTSFDDEKDSVCRTVKSPVCALGDLEGSNCVSQESPCSAGFKLDEDNAICTRSLPLNCPAGTKVITADSRWDLGGPSAFCCPAIEGMALDAKGRCTVRATLKECPEGMRHDPADDEKCIYTPQTIDCVRGELDKDTGFCVEKTKPKCDVGELDTVSGKCILGPPKCDSLGLDYEYDATTNRCYLNQVPRCPDESKLIGGQCISDYDSKCPEEATHSPDFKHCVYAAPPKCDGKGTYDRTLQLCVADNPPVCPHAVVDVRLEGLVCVSTAEPACPPGSGTDFDPTTGLCVGKQPPKCSLEDFHFSRQLGKCVSKFPPECKGEGFVHHDGQCISDQKPECPSDSDWVQALKACISRTRPCGEGTPNSDGNCVSSRPPACKATGTHFQAGVGCVADDVEPQCLVQGTKFNKDTRECEAEEGPQCKGVDLERHGDMCVSKTQRPHCPPQTESTPDGRCVAKSVPVCDRNNPVLTFDPPSGLCVGGKAECLGDATLDSARAKCITASSRTCFALLSCPDVVDDQKVLGVF